jgi:hypothetical protein
MSTFTWEDLLSGVDTIQEVRYAIAAMYSLQLYEWFASYVSIPRSANLDADIFVLGSIRRFLWYVPSA